MNLPIDYGLLNKPEIEDVQNTPDARRIAIDLVGIRGIRHPVRVKDKSGGVQATVAFFNMYVALPHHVKGTHMSRFIELLNRPGREISLDSFEALMREMVTLLEADTGQVEMRFPYFINKRAPVSGVESLMDYDVTLTGKIVDGEFTLTTQLLIPVTSLCPCSKKISSYGAHNQRSHVTLTVRTHDFIWLEDLIALAEAQASSQLYGLLKRPDEKYVTEFAYDNPKFVEDLVRDIAAELNRDARIRHYVVECENFESIHNHSAYALIEKTP